MGGQIRVESEVGKGSAFTFTIRAGLPERSPEPQVSRGMVVIHGAERGACLAEMLANGRIEADLIDDPTAALEIIKWAGKLGRPFTFVLIEATVGIKDNNRFRHAMASHPDLANLPVVPFDWPITQPALLKMVSAASLN